MTARAAWMVGAVCCAAALTAHSQNNTAAVGKQRAAASKLAWEIKEAGHPTLGNIRFAVLRHPVETPVGNAKVYSSAYVSCQKTSGKLAIELTNMTAPSDAGGLRPGAMPRLVCSRLEANKLVQEDLLANWDVSEIGDVLTRGFRPFPLRECVSIGVVQDVVLPEGWAQRNARIEFEIPPYNRELDAIFVTCGEVSAYAPGTPVAPARTTPAAAPVAGAWQEARTIAGGKTNVRAAPNLQSAIVTQLHPGAVVLVHRTGDEWWRAKSSRGAAFEGYVRQDRLVTTAR